MKKAIVVMMMVGLAFLMAGDASAALVAIGDPQPTGSWSQRFSKYGRGSFDRIDVLVESGTTLKLGGLENFSRNNWGGSPSSGGLFGSFRGGDTSDLGFDLHVATDVFQSFRVCFQTYAHDAMVEIENAYWDGWRWDIRPEFTPPSQVPETGSMILLCSYLAGLAGLGRKIFRK